MVWGGSVCRCHQKLEEDAMFPGAGIMVSCAPPNVGPWVLRKAENTLNHLVISLFPEHLFHGILL